MNSTHKIKALLVDPSLFTAPYDAALTEGLVAAGVNPIWAVRPVRNGDRQEIPLQYVDPFFYKYVDNLTYLPKALRTVAKGMAHSLGLLRLIGRVIRHKPDVVHMQWVVIPPLDVLALAIIKRFCPIVLTVHDTVPFNGERISLLQNLGFDLPIRLANRIIVHTASGKQTLVRRGVPEEKIAVIPHGPLKLYATPSNAAAPRDPRWTFVLFGEIKPYKGFDLLVEAVGQLDPETRSKTRVIVAGRPRMDIQPIIDRIKALKLESTFDVRPKRLSEQEMADLFEEADSFIFPYRQIDASGVYFLVKSFNKWMIASNVGIFKEDLQDELDGNLIEPENISALHNSINKSIKSRPATKNTSNESSWRNIGIATKILYSRINATQK